LSKSSKYGFAVFIVCSDKDMQAFGRPRLCVNSESIATYDKVINRVIVQRA